MDDPSDDDKVLPFRRPGSGPTFGELAEAWLRRESARLVEPANERRHIQHLRALWPLTEADLRPWVVSEALAALLRPSGHLGAATVNKVRITGRQIISSAQLYEQWRGGINPFNAVKRVRQVRPVHRMLALREVRRLLPSLRPDRRREALCMLYLGLRPGELKGLQKCDVDLLARTITIRRSNARDVTKTGKVRVVPIPDKLRRHLVAAIDASPPSSPLVFPAKHGRHQRKDAKLTRMLKAALKLAGLVTGFEYICRRKGCGHREQRRQLERERDCPACGFRLWVEGIPLPVRFYDLRHSAASLHREAGCDPLVIQLLLGHEPKSVTDSVYTHMSLEYQRRQLNKLRI